MKIFVSYLIIIWHGLSPQTLMFQLGNPFFALCSSISEHILSPQTLGELVTLYFLNSTIASAESIKVNPKPIAKITMITLVIISYSGIRRILGYMQELDMLFEHES